MVTWAGHWRGADWPLTSWFAAWHTEDAAGCSIAGAYLNNGGRARRPDLSGPWQGTTTTRWPSHQVMYGTSWRQVAVLDRFQGFGAWRGRANSKSKKSPLCGTFEVWWCVKKTYLASTSSLGILFPLYWFWDPRISLLEKNCRPELMTNKCHRPITKTSGKTRAKNHANRAKHRTNRVNSA